ncbi:MAG: class I SAM-dependent methyltransferase [Actinomycetes bacterium]
MTRAQPTPLDRWSQALATWAIPQEILDQAPASPWQLPVGRFAGRADAAVANPRGWSYERAASALPLGGSVLDVGAGAGAASLPLAGRAGRLTGVDTSEAMLEAFRERAYALSVPAETVVGTWPDVAESVAVHDVVVVHHVMYNVAQLEPFVRALTDRARERVVVEVPPVHPMTWSNPLWKQFWGVDRPTVPTSDDLVAALRFLGVHDLVVYRWHRFDPDATPLDERVALVTARLCLTEDRRPDVERALRDHPPIEDRDVVTIAWAGSA